ncbi:unnamed protein product [Paramecium sonneborni]|uniref:Uncharacterized protein n=1 Tax=Paramecium sonneborni TaxID=65129 RepID=A0A8S1M8L2_9CILI|nr:unnamed protein product [Paramecium sonneborni]
MRERKQQNKNHKINVVIVKKEVISKIVKTQKGSINNINFIKLRNENLSFDATETVIRKYFQCISKLFNFHQSVISVKLEQLRKYLNQYIKKKFKMFGRFKNYF